VRNLRELGALAAVADPSPAARELAAKVAPGVRLFDRVDAVMADAAIAGVVVATPAETHAAVCGQQARAAGRIRMVGHILEYHPAVLKLRRWSPTVSWARSVHRRCHRPAPV
jgi:UDP-2-acetamido-3-amino-2,3-dideoxy-glucuronate N-acetyltransferase